METTVDKLRVGDRLVIGHYTAKVDNFSPPPITWLKTNKQNEFISEFVLDLLSADSFERIQRTDGRSINDYWTSNLQQYLCSQDCDWYSPTHEHDVPPLNPYNVCGDYATRPGFLYGWNDYEINCLEPMHFTVQNVSGQALVRIPFPYEVCSDGLQLFHRKGVRAKPSADAKNRFDRNGYTHFAPYWMMPLASYTNCWEELWVNSNHSFRSVNHTSGIRPIIKVKFDTQVTLNEFGQYVVVGHEDHLIGHADLLNLLGIA